MRGFYTNLDGIWTVSGPKVLAQAFFDGLKRPQRVIKTSLSIRRRHFPFSLMASAAAANGGLGGSRAGWVASEPAWRGVDASSQALFEEGLRHVDAPAAGRDLRVAEAAKVRAELLAMLGRDEAWLMEQMKSHSFSLLLAPLPLPDTAASPLHRTAAAAQRPNRGPCAAEPKEGRGAPGARSVLVCPRRKALSAYTGSSVKVHWSPASSTPQRLDFDAIRPYVGLPQRLAAAYLDISVTLLKAICRKLGYSKWSEMRGAALASASCSEGTNGESEDSESSTAPSPAPPA